jgi:hypothetical protein
MKKVNKIKLFNIKVNEKRSQNEIEFPKNILIISNEFIVNYLPIH